MPSGYPRRDYDQPPQRRRQRARPSGNARNLPVELKDAKRGIRLQKAMADAGVAARRDCEDIILQGRVKVNGTIVAAMPAWVDPTADRIEVDGRPMRRVRKAEENADKIYVLLNKPRNVISTTDDPDQRRTVADIVQLPPDLRRRLFPVGRLDADSNGIILMTNDGELANRLTHPRYGVPKQYAVSIRGRLTQEDITTLKEGIHLAHLSHDAAIAPTVKRAAMAKVELLGYGSDRNNNERTRILVTLREGQNREIRRMIAKLGFKVRRLERVAIGPLSSRGLGVGQWRFLEPKELTQLQRIANKYGDGLNDDEGDSDADGPSEGQSETQAAPRPSAQLPRRRLPNNTEELRAMFGDLIGNKNTGEGEQRAPGLKPPKIKRSVNAPGPQSSRRRLPNTTEELRSMYGELTENNLQEDNLQDNEPSRQPAPQPARQPFTKPPVRGMARPPRTTGASGGPDSPYAPKRTGGFKKPGSPKQGGPNQAGPERTGRSGRGSYGSQGNGGPSSQSGRGKGQGRGQGGQGGPGRGKGNGKGGRPSR